MMQIGHQETNAYEAIRIWLQDSCSIHYPPHKAEILRQRLDRVRREFRLGSFKAMIDALQADQGGALRLAIMHAASTNHTYFYRESDILTDFCTRILPDLLSRGEVRLWSAACSSGDECYSLAMIIADLHGVSALKRVRILGTDLSAPVVSAAENGIFGPRHVEHLPSAVRQRFMTPAGEGQWSVSDTIRAACTFRRLNLKTRPYPFRNRFHAVFCRNVLYYFTEEDQAATLAAIAEVTEPGGWLVTSVTENVRDLSQLWVPAGNAIFRQGGHTQ